MRAKQATPSTRIAPGDFGFEFRDYGPIAEARIVPRRLTVLVGPSGSGKSFAATAMYAFAHAGQTLLDAVAGDYQLVGHDVAVKAMISTMASGFKADWLGATLSDKQVAARRAWQVKNMVLPGRHLATLVMSHIERLLEAEKVDLRRQNAVTGPLVWFGGGSPSAEMAAGANLQPNCFAPHFFNDAGHDLLRTWGARQGLSSTADLTPGDTAKAASVHLIGTMAHALQTHFGPAPLLFPAGRTGLLAVSHVVTIAALTEGFRARGPISQFLPDFARAGRAPDGAMATVVKEIEARLHGGTIGAQAAAGPMPKLEFNAAGGLTVPMERASSSVAELAPVTFILRKFAKKDSLVVIEEPEAHLHPDKQLVLADALARLVRAGVRLVITTHSDLLIRKLGAIVMETAIADRAAPARQLGPADLRADEVAVYRFAPSATGGFVAQAEPVNIEAGLDTDELAEVDDRLYDERRKLRERLGNVEA